jgi:hypothetical protein
MKIYLSIFSLLIFCQGCSFLSKVSTLEPTGKESGSICKTCYSYYSFKLKTISAEFSNDSVSITFCPSPKPGLPLLIGPPYLPVIPNVFILMPLLNTPKDSFFVDIKVSATHPGYRLDLNKIYFYIGGGSQINPIKTSIINEYGFGAFQYHHVYEPSGNLIIIQSQPFYIRYFFNIKNTRVKFLRIKTEIDPAKPVIEFRKKIRYGFRPLYFET